MSSIYRRRSGLMLIIFDQPLFELITLLLCGRSLLFYVVIIVRTKEVLWVSWEYADVMFILCFYYDVMVIIYFDEFSCIFSIG